MILGTDMARHEKFMRELVPFVEAETTPPEVAEAESQASPDVPEEQNREKALERKLFLMKTVIHAADLSGPTKPHDAMMLTTKRVLIEFWEQGDEEKRLGLPMGPMCDRERG